ncbi:MAG: DNA polymerase III subunit beta, partial [Oscillospiraceae bacterium]|nr:DNA polymerase III subunit beta [Oscillospiraceae bacterium]
MKFTCERSLLQQAVSIAARAASPKNPMPTLEGLLLEAVPGGLMITGYDLKRAIHTAVDATVTEQGSLVLSAKMLSSIVSSLPEGIVTVENRGMNTAIVCGSADYALIGMDARDFPELPDVEQQRSVSLPQNLLGRMIRQTIFAVSDNESRPIYTGEKFDIADGFLTIVAVDGYRLALRREPVEGMEEEPCSFVVPGTSLGDLEKLCADTEDPVQISLGSKYISFSVGNTVLL